MSNCKASATEPRRSRRRWPKGVGPLAAVLLLGPASAFADGTPAGTDIVNQATATYQVGEATFTEPSNPVLTEVAEILDVVVTWQDANEVPVNPGAEGEVLTFLVTNIGNGTDSYTLTGLCTLTGDDFDPVPVNLFLDTNGNGVYEPGVDVPYSPGVNDPVLAADSSVVVFAVNDMPGDVLDGETGDCQLTATSNTGTGDPGTVFEGAGDDGTNAVVGWGGATDSDVGTYIVSGVTVTIGKSAVVADPFGGSEPVPGATITYAIQVAVSGVGTAENLTITDPIPEHTTYVPGSLTLDAAGLTDARDGDAGDVGGTSANTVTVFLGPVSAGAADRVIHFTVTID